MNQNQPLKSNQVDLIYKDETYAIIGAAMEVYNVLGPGFLEKDDLDQFLYKQFAKICGD